MAYTWIKLYRSILYDPKYGRLTSDLFRIYIQLLIAASEYNQDGVLEPVQDLAWRFRTTGEDILSALRALSEAGLVENTPEGWLVVNFAREQAPMESTERVRQYRQRQKALKEDETSCYEDDNDSCNEVAEEVSSSTSSSASVSNSESNFGDRGVGEGGVAGIVPGAVPSSFGETYGEGPSLKTRGGIRMSPKNTRRKSRRSGTSSRAAAEVPGTCGEDPVSPSGKVPDSFPGTARQGRCSGSEDPVSLSGEKTAGPVEDPASPGGKSSAVNAQNIGAVTPLIAESLREMDREYSPPWVVAAIQEAVRSNSPSLAYMAAILQRWKRDGFRSGKNTPKKHHEHRGAEVQANVDAWLNR